MKKRILSLCLALCLLLPCLPLSAISAAAVAAEDSKIAVTFVSATGKTIVTRHYDPGFVRITAPTEAEMTGAGLSATDIADIIGWYYHAPDGKFYDIGAFTTIYLENDLTITPFTRVSHLSYAGSHSANIGAPFVDENDKVSSWQNGFRIGYVARENPFGTFTAYTGLATAGDERILCYNTAGSGDQWTNGGAYTVSTSHHTFIVPNTANSNTLALSWTALAAGTVDITMNLNLETYLLVIHNGKVIYPAEMADMTTQKTDWPTDSTATGAGQKTLATGLSVAAGDEIRFAFARSGSNSALAAWPTITYTSDLSNPTLSDEIVQYGTTNFADNRPVFDAATDSLNYRGNWELVYYANRDAIKKNGGELFTSGMYLDETNGAVTIEKYAGKDINNVSVGATIKADARWGDGTGSANTYALFLKDGVAGYRYTSPCGGTMQIDFTRLGKIGALTFWPADTVAFAIYVDGAKVWPKGDDWYSLGAQPAADVYKKNITDAANATDADARNITVKPGSTVEMLVCNTGGSVYSANGLMMEADLTYTSTTGHDQTTNFESNLPTYDDAANLLTPNGNWDLVYYDNLSALVAGDGYSMTHKSGTDMGTPAVSAPQFAGLTASGAGAVACVNEEHGSWTVAGNKFTVAVQANHIAGYRYISEYTGFLDIDFTRLGRLCGMGYSSQSVSYAIYVDGVKVWPSGDDWYPLAVEDGNVNIAEKANAIDESARRNIFVRHGSRVEMLATCTGNIWAGAGQQMLCDLNFKTRDPGLTVDADVGSAFAMNLAVGNPEYTDVTVKLNGAPVEAKNGVYTLESIPAKEISKKMTYEVSGTVEGYTGLIAHGEISMADYLTILRDGGTAAEDIRSLSQAILQYGAAAEKYFGGGSLDAEETARIATAPTVSGEAARVPNANPENNLFTFSGVSLLLDDEIGVKLHINALSPTADLTPYTVRVTSELVNGSGWTLEPRQDSDATVHFKSIVAGIPQKGYATDLHITVMQGETAVSDTLVYSIGAYVNRMYETSDDLTKNLLHGMVAVGAAATGAHTHIPGEWTYNAEEGTQTRSCRYCEVGTETRPLYTLSLSYQDAHTFAGEVYEIFDENVTSNAVGTGTKDAHVLTRSGRDTIVAAGVGTAKVKTAEGYFAVTVTPATLNMLFLSGQSNAEGAHASGSGETSADYDSADYAKYFMRAEDRQAYFTYTYHGLDITAEENSGRRAESFVIRTLTWGDETRYGSVQNGPASTTLTNKNSTFANAGIAGALAYEWVEQTGEKVWVVNASHGGHPIQNFLPEGTTGTGDVPVTRYNDYEQAVAVYTLALQTVQNEVAAGHFTLNHMVFYWLQGESDSVSNDLYYQEQFARLYSELKKDVVYAAGTAGEKKIELGSLLAVRSCKDNSGNSYAENYLTGPRLAQYEMAASSAEPFEDLYFVSNATESWTGSDENVENYFKKTYGSAENFRKIFGYEMPTTMSRVHPNIHYAIYGYNEMGMEAARNSLKILNSRGLSDYDLPYAAEELSLRLVNVDGYTEQTEIMIDTIDNYAYVIPQLSPVWRMGEGLRLVSETEGYVFEDFRLVEEAGYADTTDRITFSVYLGNDWLQRYDLPLYSIASMRLQQDVLYKQYGGDTAENPASETHVYAAGNGSWTRGWVSYSDFGTYHAFDYTDPANGWQYTTGESLWGAGEAFHGAYHSSMGFGITKRDGSAASIRYNVLVPGVVVPYVEMLNANLNDFDLAIAVDGHIVWPKTASRLDYDDHSGWYRVYNGIGEEKATTMEELNEALSECYIELGYWEQVDFLIEYVDGTAQCDLLPAFRHVNGEGKDVIVPPQGFYQPPVAKDAFTTTGFDPANNTTHWDCGFLTYATNTYEAFTVVEAANGWLHKEGETLWTDPAWHGAFWHTAAYSLAFSGVSGEDIAFRYTADKAGTLIPQLSRLTMKDKDMSLAIYVKRADGTAYTAAWPQDAAVDAAGEVSGFYPIYNGSAEGETLTTAAEVNASLASLSIEVGVGDEVLFVFAPIEPGNSLNIAYPAVFYTAVS